MPKRITETQKEQIMDGFINGASVQSLADKFNFSKLTISRNLKNLIGESKYKSLYKANKSSEYINNTKNEESLDFPNSKEKNDSAKKIEVLDASSNNKEISEESFFEIPPLNYEIDSFPQPDFASIPLDKVVFPNIVYMIVDKHVELEIKFLKDYPEWDFLSQEDLNRKTIQVYTDLKTTKRLCKKDEKVIKVPNTDVFKVVAPILNSRGISRMIFNNQLIVL